ncbi:unnamed protein product, partial [marine sediment metagenome]
RPEFALHASILLGFKFKILKKVFIMVVQTDLS